MSYNGFYQKDWGLLIKERFKISSDGIEYNKKRIALNKVTGISWGATKILYGGIFPVTTYTINVKSDTEELIILPKNNEIFNNIVNNIWQAVGINLMISMLLELREGKNLHIGQIEFNDLGIFLKNNRFLQFDKKFFTWDEGLTIHSANGNIIVESKSEDYLISVDYYTNNAPVFENLIRAFFRRFNPYNPRLSILIE